MVEEWNIGRMGLGIIPLFHYSNLLIDEFQAENLVVE
jgi:hypothetical protein